MDSQLQSISKLFTERLYRIPDYQRGYAWGEKQLKDYWSDIQQLEEGKNHYIGVLTLEAVSKLSFDQWLDDKWIIESKSFTPYYVVDGQQRLTTTVILIQAITELTLGTNKLNYTSIEEIRKKFIYDSKDEGISRSYIFGYEKDNPSYEFLKNKIFQETSNSGYIGEETIYTLNLEYARSFFIEKLRELSVEEVEKIYKKITQNLLFNTYTISSDIDVFVAFETMNNRGKPLSNLELLKNRLIYISTKFNASDYEKEKLRRVINDCWKSLYHFLGKNKKKPLNDDLFLSNHFFMYFGKEVKKEKQEDIINRRIANVYRDTYVDYLLETKFTTKNIINVSSSSALTLNDVYKYSESLQSTIKIWYDFFNPLQSTIFLEEEKYLLDKLNRVGIKLFLPLLTLFYSKNPTKKESIKFLELLERYYFISSITGPRFSIGQSEIYYYTLHFCNRRSVISSIINFYEERIASITEDPEKFQDILIERFNMRSFYGWDAIRYFLYEYEQSLRLKSKTSHDKLLWDVLDLPISNEDFITVEHIYPQESSKECWNIINKRFRPKERKILVNSLGNLLPLSKPKNSSLQNECFSSKVDSKGTIGYRYGSFSENQVSAYKDWTAETILDRGLKMLDFMEENWGLPLGTRDRKVQLLGLKFVEKQPSI
ncbi:DUF262 domain-containing protein [Spirosoma taeanense]|uniref:DUF262 domain-containing protein n=1 Tax=Spirosoma taeanense TaxID=2735870 RepID=A0A6M5YAI2_9BACT|nr:DUF262 domain-containing protein [Spirosoma taeanense]QJW90213.1 DUF262 domain-containing protein [Spirosoma taeanense]